MTEPVHLDVPVAPPVTTMPPLGEGPGEHPIGHEHIPDRFDPSPGIGTTAASPIPAAPTAKEMADKAKAEKIAADKAAMDKETHDRELGDKVIGDMEAGIRDKLIKMTDDLGGEFHKLHAAYIDMPDEVKDHTMYKPLGDKISSVEALLNTLAHTAASFPVPVELPVPHGSL